MSSETCIILYRPFVRIKIVAKVDGCQPANHEKENAANIDLRGRILDAPLRVPSRGGVLIQYIGVSGAPPQNIIDY
jgi:hypothetical protein